MDEYIISSGLIYNNKSQILLVQHTPEFGAGHYWYVPGGTANKGEDAIDALKREIKEETNIDVITIGKLIYTVKHTNYKRAWYSDIYVYVIKDWNGEIKINDPDGDTVKVKWFNIKQAIRVIKKVPFQVMSEPLINYLEGKEIGKEWSYIEHDNGKIEFV